MITKLHRTISVSITSNGLLPIIHIYAEVGTVVYLHSHRGICVLNVIDESLICWNVDTNYVILPSFITIYHLFSSHPFSLD